MKAMQITIVGLGQIGASLGLALRPYRQQIRRLGLDKLMPVAGKARAQGAIDKVMVNLSLAVSRADVVILAVPLSAMPEALSILGTELRPDAVVLDAAPARQQVAAWVREFLPPSIGYAGFWPLLRQAGGKPRADLFRNGLWLVGEDERLTPRAWDVTRALAALCGARTRRLPTDQVDALTTHYDLLPRLLSFGLLNATVEQPGWFDGRKLAARPFAWATAGMGQPDDDDSLREALLQEPERALWGLQTLQSALGGLRQALENEAAFAAYWQRIAPVAEEPVALPPEMSAEEALALLLG